jgi:hypothetical protein
MQAVAIVCLAIVFVGIVWSAIEQRGVVSRYENPPKIGIPAPELPLLDAPLEHAVANAPTTTAMPAELRGTRPVRRVRAPEPPSALAAKHRAAHVASLRDLVGYFTDHADAMCLQDPATGLWRAWLDAPTYEHAAVRAEWSSEAGAWRLLLRAVRAFGGVWTTRACARGRERAAA